MSVVVERHFTVATFVVRGDRVLLLRHRKLELWLPPGGHIETNELPDVAAVREVLEETGVRCRLLPGLDQVSVDPHGPLLLARPEGIQVEQIAEGHGHIDLIYVAVPESSEELVLNEEEGTAVDWFPVTQLAELGATEEVQRWARYAVRVVQQRILLAVRP
ncbi:MAG: NUDIX domain-containing protein [Chloroflexi bacterium]|nr:NUDIX domain-containing protein [Chloroflexota bacterium]